MLIHFILKEFDVTIRKMNIHTYIHDTLANDIEKKVIEYNEYMLECLCKDHHLNINQISTWYKQFSEKRKNNFSTETPDPNITIIDNTPVSSISSVACTKPKVVRKLRFDLPNTNQVESKRKRCEPPSNPVQIPPSNPVQIPPSNPVQIPKRRLATIPKRLVSIENKLSTMRNKLKKENDVENEICHSFYPV